MSSLDISESEQTFGLYFHDFILLNGSIFGWFQLTYLTRQFCGVDISLAKLASCSKFTSTVLIETMLCSIFNVSALLNIILCDILDFLLNNYPLLLGTVLFCATIQSWSINQCVGAHYFCFRPPS